MVAGNNPTWVQVSKNSSRDSCPLPGATLIEAESANFVTSRTTGAPSSEITVILSRTFAGISIVGVTQKPTSLVSCTWGVALIAYPSPGETDLRGDVLTASL